MCRSSFYLFEAQLVFMLGFFLVVPEIIRGMYFANKYKVGLGLLPLKKSLLTFDSSIKYCISFDCSL